MHPGHGIGEEEITFYRGKEIDGLSSEGQKGDANPSFPPCYHLSNSVRWGIGKGNGC